MGQPVSQFGHSIAKCRPLILIGYSARALAEASVDLVPHCQLDADRLAAHPLLNCTISRPKTHCSPPADEGLFDSGPWILDHFGDTDTRQCATRFALIPRWGADCPPAAVISILQQLTSWLGPYPYPSLDLALPTAGQPLASDLSSGGLSPGGSLSPELGSLSPELGSLSPGPSPVSVVCPQDPRLAVCPKTPGSLSPGPSSLSPGPSSLSPGPGSLSAGPSSSLSPGLPTIVFAGGLENWPELHEALEKLAQEKRSLEQSSCKRVHIASPSCAEIAWLRLPATYSHLAAAADLGFPESSHRPPPPAEVLQKMWLTKPLRSGGGLNVQFAAQRAATTCVTPNASHEPQTIWQRYIPGRCLGVVCLLTQQGPQILGATEAWCEADLPATDLPFTDLPATTRPQSSSIPPDLPPPKTFQYRGSWGPVPLTQDQAARVLRLCGAAAERIAYRGWLQFDFIEDEHGKLWLLECNPRWTSGMEVLRQTGDNPLQQHLAANAWTGRLPAVANRSATFQHFAKWIHYAKGDSVIDRRLVDRLETMRSCNVDGLVCSICDLPSIDQVGGVIPAGAPLVTITAGTPNVAGDSKSAEEDSAEQGATQRHASERVAYRENLIELRKRMLRAVHRIALNLG